MATSKIKVGDTVRVIAGKDKDKEGKVLSIDRKKNRIIVEGVNKVMKHSKPDANNQTGGIVEKEGSIDISNVMYVYKGKAVRVGFEYVDGKKVRIAKTGGKNEYID